MLVPFYKYSGCGNDFLLIDHRTPFLPSNLSPFSSKLCDRQRGIGADGLILLENSSHADAKMLFFNANGTKADMCGNGLRCLVQFLNDLGVKKSHYLIETPIGDLSGHFEKNQVTIHMPPPKDIQWNIHLTLDNIPYKFHYLNTTVPHIVTFVPSLSKVNLPLLGKKLRHHPQFAPFGTNVNFAEITSPNTLHMATFERGVEAETLACGTGAIATALTANAIKGLKSPIKIYPPSHQALRIQFKKNKQLFSQIKMSGPVTFIFEGKVPYSF